MVPTILAQTRLLQHPLGLVRVGHTVETLLDLITSKPTAGTI